MSICQVEVIPTGSRIFERRVFMKPTKNIFKKVTAAAAVSALLLSGTSSVLAATYQEAEKAALSQLITDFSAYWDVVMKDQVRAMAGSKAVMTLKLEDSGKTLLSAMSGGMDFSWLNTLTMDVTASITEGKEVANTAVLLNDAPLCNMNVYMELADMTEYFQVPELSEAWIKIPLMASMELSEEELAEAFETEEEAQAYQEYLEEYEASMSQYFSMIGNLTAVLPETAVLSTLLDRYGNIIIDNTAEGTEAEEALSVEGISENCTVYESSVTEAGFLTMMESILTTAKGDQELKGLLDQWSAAGGEDLNAQLQAGVDELLGEFSGTGEAGSDTPLISTKIWTNAEGKIVGREISLVEDTESYPVLTWKSPSAEGTTALLLQIGKGEETVALTGTGQSAEGLLNGNYVFAANDVKLIGVNAENLETNPETPGYYNGKLSFSVLDKGTEESPNPLAAFGLDMNLTSDPAAETSQIDLAVTNSGAALVTLSVTGSYAEAGAAAPEQAALDGALDFTAEESELTYVQGMDWSEILSNASAAGVPEEFVTAIDQMFQQYADSVANPETEAAEEVAVDDAA